MSPVSQVVVVSLTDTVAQRQHIQVMVAYTLDWFQGVSTAGASIGPFYADQTISEVLRSRRFAVSHLSGIALSQIRR
jgi:hypothetical protein